MLATEFVRYSYGALVKHGILYHTSMKIGMLVLNDMKIRAHPSDPEVQNCGKERIRVGVQPITSLAWPKM